MKSLDLSALSFNGHQHWDLEWKSPHASLFFIGFTSRDSSLEQIGTFDVQNPSFSDASLSTEKGSGVPNVVNNKQTVMELA